MIALVDAGVPRSEAHELVRKLSMEAEESGATLKEVLVRDELVASKLGDDIDSILDPASYTGASGEIIDRVLKICGRG